MARLLGTTIAVVFIVLILGGSSDGKAVAKRDIEIMTWDEFIQWLCQHSVYNPSMVSVCGTTTTSSTSTTTSTSALAVDSNDDDDSTSTTSSGPGTTTSMSASALQRSQWCELPNGTTVAYAYTFIHEECSICQCLDTHVIRCTTLQCMPTYCIDGSTPTPKDGQCCAQCAYEKTSTACVINGITFPHGTLLRRTSDNVQCWCQLGSVECRKATNSLYSSLDLWGAGSAVYVIVIIICVLLIFGTLICCGGTLFFYYYYKRQQQSAQQAYAEYYNSAGWQPVGEDGQVVDDTSAEAKQAEAEQSQEQFEYPTGHSEQYIPPPYAVYNGSYVNEQGEKDQK